MARRMALLTLQALSCKLGVIPIVSSMYRSTWPKLFEASKLLVLWRDERGWIQIEWMGDRGYVVVCHKVSNGANGYL
jgi:hypothetical protein